MREIIAILRGITPGEAAEVGAALVHSGIDKIEVPLNSPDAFESIRILIAELGNIAHVGAGTVLSVEEVEKLANLGARLVVSPNCNPEVIAAAKDAGMEAYPGVFTPSECFSAINAGADGLKFFPASVLGASGFKAIKAVLPAGTRTYAVGGIDENDFGAWIKMGVTGFGIGTSLYKPGASIADVARQASAIVARYDA